MQVNIVYMGNKPNGDVLLTSLHHSMLEAALGSMKSAKESLLYSYQRSFNGFAAKLSDEEVAELSDMDGVVSIIPNMKVDLHTRRSWDFMGFDQSYVGDSKGADIIIGLIDTGIWPESESFNGEGFGSPPAKWKGTCQTNNFTCNNNFNDDKDIKSPRDAEGHGTHIASIAAGREAAGANYFGLAQGVASGGCPQARIDYKACWAYGCAYADVLAAFDDAIADGVDIISISLGPSSVLQHFPDDMDSRKIKGKIVLCEVIWDGSGVIMAGGVGVIMRAPEFNDVGFSFPFPTTLIKYEDFPGIMEYIRSNKNPIATILAAYVMDPKKNEDKEFAYRSGHINPVKAVDPGLVFDASEADYINFLCKQGYNTTKLRLVTGDDSVCTSTKPGRPWDLIYPSLTVAIEDGQKITAVCTRTVTNVEFSNLTYSASVYMPYPVKVTVEPQVLSFSGVGEKKAFAVKVSGPEITQQPIFSGSIVWKDDDGVHEVRTPLVVYTVLPSAFSSSNNNPSQRTKTSSSEVKGFSVYHRNGILVFQLDSAEIEAMFTLQRKEKECKLVVVVLVTALVHESGMDIKVCMNPGTGYD
ncbi:hypothetical protein QYF36_015079 [Acer negundo]|nr:hypothetical protein QYF36_015079 [Acer negundo]